MLNIINKFNLISQLIARIHTMKFLQKSTFYVLSFDLFDFQTWTVQNEFVEKFSLPFQLNKSTSQEIDQVSIFLSKIMCTASIFFYILEISHEQ